MDSIARARALTELGYAIAHLGRADELGNLKGNGGKLEVSTDYDPDQERTILSVYANFSISLDSTERGALFEMLEGLKPRRTP